MDIDENRLRELEDEEPDETAASEDEADEAAISNMAAADGT